MHSEFLNRILNLDAIGGQKLLEDGSVNCIVTSPPYFCLRDYKTTPYHWPAMRYSIFGFEIAVEEMTCELGQENTPNAFIGHLVLIFREGYRVLRDDGTLWVNLGDSYWGGKGMNGNSKARNTAAERGAIQSGGTPLQSFIKPKDLIGIPWMFAYAMRDDGWYLRQDIIWAKPNG